MENNKLIKTDTLVYKINTFFRNLLHFGRNNKEETIKDNFVVNKEALKNVMEESNSKRVLADNLLNGEEVITNLTDEEVDEMIEYFTKDIEGMDKELLRIKENILRMKKKLKK